MQEQVVNLESEIVLLCEQYSCSGGHLRELVSDSLERRCVLYNQYLKVLQGDVLFVKENYIKKLVPVDVYGGWVNK